VRKYIPHSHVGLSPLLLIEATGVCIPIGDSEVLRILAAVYKSPGHALNDTDITEFLSCRRKSLLAGDLNAERPFFQPFMLETTDFTACK
jgi:hypothetical protein